MLLGRGEGNAALILPICFLTAQSAVKSALVVSVGTVLKYKRRYYCTKPTNKSVSMRCPEMHSISCMQISVSVMKCLKSY